MAALLVAVAATQCTRAADPGDVLLIVVDTLRALGYVE